VTKLSLTVGAVGAVDERYSLPHHPLLPHTWLSAQDKHSVPIPESYQNKLDTDLRSSTKHGDTEPGRAASIRLYRNCLYSTDSSHRWWASLIIRGKVLLVNAIPDLGSRFINYGLRSTPPEGQNIDQNGKQSRLNDGQVGLLSKTLDSIAALQVPHGSFAHFYVVSVLSSLFWGFQIVTQGTILTTICHAQIGGSKSSMSLDQIVLAWLLLTVQGLRRLLESYFVTKHSASRMWFVHWYLGMAFYLAMGVAIWIEGAGT